MKRFLTVLMAATLAVASQAAVSVYESFGDATPDLSVNGYQSATAGYSQGVSGAWSELAGNGANLKHRTTSTGWTAAEANLTAIGTTYTLQTDGFFNFLECNSWGLERVQVALASPVDMTVNGTWYMSFVSSSSNFDYAALMGFNDGTNELMWGNAYTGTSSKGLVAHYGAISSFVNNNLNNGATGVSPTMASSYDVILYVAEFQQEIGTGLTVSIYAYDLNTITELPSTIAAAGTALWSTTLAGVTGVFTNFELELSGASGYPSIGQPRVGQSWADVTVGNVQLVAPSNGAEYIPVDTNLEWIVDNGWAVDVYLSDGYSEPNGAPVLSLVDAENASGLYDPPTNLSNSQWYYWRLDELEPNTVGYIVHPGIVWSFKTVGLAPDAMTISPAVGQTVAAGSDAVFTANGVNVETWTWYKQGNPTPLSNGAEYTINDNELTVLNTNVNDEGFYYCVGSNSTTPDTAQTGLSQLLTERLVGHWKLDNGLTDSVDEEIAGAVGHDGVSIDPNYVAVGKDGGALQFYGDADSLVRIADGNDFFNFYPRGYTVSAWVNMPEKTTGNWGAYVCKQGFNPTRGFILTHQGGGQAVHTLRQSFNDLGSNTDVDDNSWHLVTGTYDADSKQGKVYVDGVQKNQATNTGIPQPSPAALIFGAERLTGEVAYIGLLDDVRIWSYPLDPVTIATLYADFNPGVSVCVANPEYDIAGPSGVGDEFRDCVVNLYDFVPRAQAWLDCNIVPTCLP